MWAMCLFVCVCVCVCVCVFVSCMWKWHSFRLGLCVGGWALNASTASLSPPLTRSLSQAYTHTYTQGSSWPSIAVPQCIMGSAGCLSVNCELSVPLSQLSHWLALHQCHFFWRISFSFSLFWFCFVFGQITPTHGLWDIVVFLLYFFPFLFMARKAPLRSGIEK